jgi:hypothetical protein
MSEITVLYTCKVCGIEKQPLAVPERAVAVDIRLWMDQTIRRVGQDHALRQPPCEAKAVDLMIPVNDETPMLGKK